MCCIDKLLKVTRESWALPSLHGGSLIITLSVPLKIVLDKVLVKGKLIAVAYTLRAYC